MGAVNKGRSSAPGADWVRDESEYRERMAKHRDESRTDVAALTLSQGPDDIDTLDVRGTVAWWTGKAGDAAEARDLFEALVADAARTRRKTDPEVLSFRGEHAHWIGMAGDPVAARDLLAVVVAGFTALLQESTVPVGGWEPLQSPTLYFRNKHVCWIGMAGDPEAARDLYAELIPDSASVHGPRHGNTIQARIEHARWTGEGGEPAAARDLYAALHGALTWWGDREYDVAEHYAWWAARAHDTGDTDTAR